MQGAEVLVLLQDPSGEAQLGSGFISRDDNDPTAHNSTLAAEAGDLAYSKSIHYTPNRELPQPRGNSQGRDLHQSPEGSVRPRRPDPTISDVFQMIYYSLAGGCI